MLDETGANALVTSEELNGGRIEARGDVVKWEIVGTERGRA